MKRFMRSLASVITTALVLGFSLPALADGSPEGPVYLALGDSQAFGFGAHPDETLGYSTRLSHWLHGKDCRDQDPAGCPLLEYVNLAVPGATSTSLIAGQLPQALALISDRNGDDDPGNDVVLITLTIGGNDIVDPVLEACSAGVTPECIQVIQTTFNTYLVNLAQILGALRDAAGADTQIIISTYDNPLGACFRAPLEAFADAVLEGGLGLAFGFNDITRAVAAAFDVDVADTFGQLDETDWVGGQDCRHPDSSGYLKMAKIFLAVVD